jgi:hypothetical protein
MSDSMIFKKAYLQTLFDQVMLRPYAHRSQLNARNGVADLQSSPFCACRQYENGYELQLPPPFLMSYHR